ncbi:MAG TPA: hypothetical protein VK726_05670 [Acetobacteraceae bacterium]|jgi:hypothetical protein|nr:hypothetical protein [Acetobacteraceae bacterium]
MRLIAAPETVLPARRRGHSAGNDFWITAYMGANRYDPGAAPPPTDGSLYPMAFLVEQDRGCVAPSHFHQADQFQVVVAGEGRLGTHDVVPVTVHFSGKYSPYGPLIAGEAGLHYFTLRNGWDPGARYMSENRALLRTVAGRRHREAVASPIAVSAACDGAAPVCEMCLPPSDDGLAVLRYELPAGTQVTGPDPAGGNGQYWVVIGGSVLHDGTELPQLACVFLSPDEAAFTAVAGSCGLSVLALQFPRAKVN